MKAQLDSISLPAANSQRLCDFYVSVFGLEENKERSHPPGFFMVSGGRGCNILIMDAQGSDTETGVKGFELGMEVDSLEGIQERVKEAGGSIIQYTQQMRWGTAITVADPEGHHINAYVFNKEDHD